MTAAIAGIPVYQSPIVPDGGLVFAGIDFGLRRGAMTLIVGPLTYFQIVHGRRPLWSRHNRGTIEAGRYRRRKK